MWFLAIVFVGALVASLLLTPKIKTENARAGSIDDMNFPKASEGAGINLILGKVLVKGPNTLWVGDFDPVPIKKKQKTGLFSSKKVIVGYTYHLGIQLGLGIGPCTLHKIICDKDELWTGTASADGAVVSINKPNLFGGKEKGGGFVGTARYYTGGWTQGINSYLEGQIGAGDVPAYRGTSHIVFEHCNIGESDQLRTMHFEMSRYTNLLGFTGGKEKVGDDMNPMEALFVIFVLGWGGLDVDPAMLNQASFIAAGETLYDEGNGISLNVSAGSDGADLAEEIIRQTNGVMFQDPTTGEIYYRLIRNDYNVEDLPVFDESNIISVRSFTSKTWEDTINQVRVKYTNRDKGYADGIAGTQDLANISAQERIRSATNSYPGVTVGQLAADLAARDLAQSSVPLMSTSLELNREGQGLLPGDVIVWKWGPYRIAQAVMRVKSLDLGALNDNRLAFEVVQDEFGVDQTVFAPPGAGGSGIVRPGSPAAAAPYRLVWEAPYFFVNAAGLSVQPGRMSLLVSATPPATSVSYDTYVSLNTTDYGLSVSGSLYTPAGTLSGAMTATAGLSTGVIGSITIASTSDEIESVSSGDAEQGAGMFAIDGELFTHEGVTDNMDGTFTLANVRRGLLDTVPSAHSNGARVWFLLGDNVLEELLEGNAVARVKLTPTTPIDTLDVATAPYDEVTGTYRQDKPLHPVDVTFDAGTPFVPPASPVGSKTIAWANRSRESLQVLGIADATDEAETLQTTFIRYRVNAGAWVDHTTTPGATDYTFDAGAILGDVVDYEIWSIRQGTASRCKWQFKSGQPFAVGALV